MRIERNPRHDRRLLPMIMNAIKILKGFPLALLPVLAGLMLLAGGFAGRALAQEPPLAPTSTLAPSPAPTATAGSPEPPTVTPPLGSLTPEPSGTGTVESGTGTVEPGGQESPVPTLTDLVPSQTSVPSATEDALAEGLAQIIEATGSSGKSLLSLDYADWADLGISLLYVLAAYLVGTWLIRWLFPRFVHRTKTVLDDRLLEASGSELRWLAVIISLWLATRRLDFLGDRTQAWLADVYFLVALVLAVTIVWRLTTLAAQEAQQRAKRSGRQKEAESLIALSVWAARLVVIIVAISITLTYFGSNVTGLAIFLAIVGLAFSLSGRDILADMVSGAVILIDRPYRIGDRLALPTIDSWGDVIEIGMRSTRILTLDNRLVIVPNSQIGKDQIINYSYPDPSYYDTVDVVIAYDNDVEQVGQLLVDTVRSVEGVQQEREIDALLMKFTENQMVFLVGWWIVSYEDFFPVHDRVSRAVIKALKEADVVLPYSRGSISVETGARPPAGLNFRRPPVETEVSRLQRDEAKRMTKGGRRERNT